MKIIWKDKNITQFMFSLFLLGVIIFLLILSIWSNSLREIFISVILMLFFIYLLSNQFLKRLTYITKEGIMLGNVSTGDKLLLKQKSYFFEWGNIRQLKIIRKAHMTPIISLLKYHLIINTKHSKKDYDCMIYDSEGFVEAIKNLKKGNLIASDSKYK